MLSYKQGNCSKFYVAIKGAYPNPLKQGQLRLHLIAIVPWALLP